MDFVNNKGMNRSQAPSRLKTGFSFTKTFQLQPKKL